MSEALIQIPGECETVLAAIEQNPVEVSPEIRNHLRRCPACSEARIHWLAMEEAPHALAPATYFDLLPERILRKLPTRASRLPRPHKLLWAAAAAILLAGIGGSGFWLGTKDRNAVEDASLPSNTIEVQEGQDAPFLENEDAMTLLSKLSQEEAEAVMRRMESSQIGHP